MTVGNKKVILYLFLFLQIPFISSCTDFLFANALVSNTRDYETIQGAIQIVPIPDLNSASGVVTLFRQDKYAQYLVDYAIFQNGELIGLLKPNSYLRWELIAGEVSINYMAKKKERCYSNRVACLPKVEKILDNNDRRTLQEFKFLAKDGDDIYLQFKPDWFIFSDVPTEVNLTIVQEADLSKINPPIYINLDSAVDRSQ